MNVTAYGNVTLEIQDGSRIVAIVWANDDGKKNYEMAWQMAAAPDLVEAAEEALRLLTNSTGNWENGVKQKLGRAIAKARGKEITDE